MITHEEQRRLWEEEHAKPTVLLQMDSNKPSGGVVKFFEFLTAHNAPITSGIEMGCGKGRNAIWLAREGVSMRGFDFSSNAIREANRRAQNEKITNVSFRVTDATETWPWPSDSLDFGIDCFASTDIESPEGRKFAISEMRRVLKPGGFLLAYLLSPDDEYHKEVMRRSPAEERNAILQPTGKFEKTFDEQDIADQYQEFEVVKKERIAKTTKFFGREYACNHFWVVFRKPR